MKKWIASLLCLSLMPGLCACGKETAKKPEDKPAVFQVGFGRVNITPTPNVGVLLAGYEDRWSEGVLNYIMATCVAITDEKDQTILLYTLDMCNSEKETAEALREKLTETTGIPGENITISGTHTHASPRQPYADNYVDLLVQAGQEALKDRAPATIETGSYDVPDMNFDRHYIMNDGTMRGDNFGSASSGYKDHASVADPTMRLIRFLREGDKKDVLMVNWQVHPKLSSTASTTEGKATRNYISSDFIGATRDYVEKNQDVLFAYYTGASGNVNALSFLPEKKNIVTKDYKVYGEQFGDHVIAALQQLKPVETGEIGSKSAPLGDRGYNLHAYTIGSSLGFATVPAEIFHQTGTQIRDGSPCETTFVLTVANGRDTYIPTDNVWDYVVAKGETPYEVRICRYPRGTAESLAQDLADMLTELAGK